MIPILQKHQPGEQGRKSLYGSENASLWVASTEACMTLVADPYRIRNYEKAARGDAQIRQPAVQLDFAVTRCPTRFARREVDEVGDQLLQLVGPVTDEEQDGDMRLHERR